MSVDNLIDDLFKELEGHPEAFPYLYNARRTEFNKGKDWVYYSGPVWDMEEPKAAIKSFLTGKWLVSGENVARFEKAFSKKYKFEKSVMVNSGSSANLVMIEAVKKYLNWSDNDEIIVSPVGFPTTIAPLVQTNLKPVFVDINLLDLNFNLDQVEEAITDKTKAIFISPVLGNPPDMDRLVHIAEKHNIKLILDGCDSLGTKWKEKELSEYCYVTSCSFYPAHHITTGEGGMVSSNEEELIALTRSFAWWGRDCYCVGSTNLSKTGACGNRFDKWLPEYEGVIDHKYFFSNMGYNLKPLDMQGALGIEQLKKIDFIHEKRRAHKNIIADSLQKHLGELVTVPAELDGAETSWFGVPIICTKNKLKTALVEYLEANKIQTRNYFAGNILQHPAYKHLDNASSYKNANQVLDYVFFVGCHPSYSTEMLDYIDEVIGNFAKEHKSLF